MVRSKYEQMLRKEVERYHRYPDNGPNIKMKVFNVKPKYKQKRRQK